MDILEQRVERLEEDTRQIKLDLAVLTARSENFATKTDVAELRAELIKEIAASEARTNIRFEKIDEKFERIDEKFERIDEKFERIDEKFERMFEKFNDINSRITWTLMIPALVAVLLWFIKTAILKI
ncbi:emp24/gp25L/p24 family protein [Erwinia sp. PsM31]|uniref:emp24/gp25L/p24 family protein n=1 Tax=Erwinia sp. PsM31 TaxID=3030535 RepID=UPI00263B1D99|nr:emp24/gp25L/p24 family protein [Erwinia sp. PsM31]